jgi:hypothetical protein
MNTAWYDWVLVVIWAVLNVWWFVHVDSASQSASDTLIGIAPIFIVSTLVFLITRRLR